MRNPKNKQQRVVGGIIMSDEKESADEKRNEDENADNRLVDGEPKSGIVPLGEVVKTDWLSDHLKSVKKAEEDRFRW